ncbi:hypothetical protein DVK07_07685 [Halorubrum sp. Atlit-26R]|nr:hypothetical protein DVK07_07685 [Halorubrum sp. Atlit-26R]
MRLRCCAVRAGLKGAAVEAGGGDVSTAGTSEASDEERSERPPASTAGALEALAAAASLTYKQPTATRQFSV